MYFIPWSDAFLLAKTAVETFDWLPLATLDKPRKEDVNNLEAIANKSIFFQQKSNISKSFAIWLPDRTRHPIRTGGGRLDFVE